MACSRAALPASGSQTALCRCAHACRPGAGPAGSEGRTTTVCPPSGRSASSSSQPGSSASIADPPSTKNSSSGCIRACSACGVCTHMCSPHQAFDTEEDASSRMRRRPLVRTGAPHHGVARQVACRADRQQAARRRALMLACARDRLACLTSSAPPPLSVARAMASPMLARSGASAAGSSAGRSPRPAGNASRSVASTCGAHGQRVRARKPQEQLPDLRLPAT